MKLWEVFKALDNNPKLKFESHPEGKRMEISLNNQGYYHLKIYSKCTGELIGTNYPGGRFNDNIHANYNWEKVYESVDFITAANSGKYIKPESCAFFYTFEDWLQKFADNNKNTVLEYMNGKWLITD